MGVQASSPASAPGSVWLPGCSPACALLQISSAGAGFKAPQQLVPPSHHHHRNWSDHRRAEQPILCRSGTSPNRIDRFRLHCIFSMPVTALLPQPLSMCSTQ